MTPPAKGRPEPVAANDLEVAQSATEQSSPLFSEKGLGDKPS
jgi:hypothetical protein